MAKLTLNNPARPRGELIEVPPLGLLENGKTYNVPGLDEDLVLGEKGAELPVFDINPERPSEVDDAPAEPQGVNPLLNLRPVRTEDTAASPPPPPPPPDKPEGGNDDKEGEN